MRRFCVAAGFALLSALPMTPHATPAQGQAPSSGPAPLILPAYPQSVLANHPTAYWHLAETSGTAAHDSVGKYDGTYREGPHLGLDGLIRTWSNHCPGFDGTNDRVTANSLASGIDWSKGFTLEAWVHVTQRAKQENIIAFNFVSGTRTPNGPGLIRDEPTDKFKYRDGDPGNPNYHFGLSKTIPVIGRTYYVVVTVDGSNHGSIYVNGVKETSFTTPVRPPANGGLFSIGAEYDAGPTPDSFWHGSLDEAAVYNHSITELRVKAHWLAGTA
jgi:hypothetical protein